MSKRSKAIAKILDAAHEAVKAWRYLIKEAPAQRTRKVELTLAQAKPGEALSWDVTEKREWREWVETGRVVGANAQWRPWTLADFGEERVGLIAAEVPGMRYQIIDDEKYFKLDVNDVSVWVRLGTVCFVPLAHWHLYQNNYDAAIETAKMFAPGNEGGGWGGSLYQREFDPERDLWDGQEGDYSNDDDANSSPNRFMGKEIYGNQVKDKEE